MHTPRGEIKVEALIDCGAELNCISENLLEQLNLPIVRRETPMKIKLAAGNHEGTFPIYVKTRPIKFTMPKLPGIREITFTPVPSLNNQLILGMPWLETYEPQIHWGMKKILNFEDLKKKSLD